MAYRKLNIEDIEDKAPNFGVESQEARHARDEIGVERIGIGHYRVRPGKRLEFAHRHKSMEEVYVVVSGSGTFRIDDEDVPVEALDVVAIDPQSWRAWEAGPDGMEVLAFGEHKKGDDESEVAMGRW